MTHMLHLRSAIVIIEPCGAPTAVVEIPSQKLNFYDPGINCVGRCGWLMKLEGGTRAVTRYYTEASFL